MVKFSRIFFLLRLAGIQIVWLAASIISYLDNLLAVMQFQVKYLNIHSLICKCRIIYNFITTSIYLITECTTLGENLIAKQIFIKKVGISIQIKISVSKIDNIFVLCPIDKLSIHSSIFFTD